MKICIASRCLWALVILKSLLCLSTGPLQESCGFSRYQHTAFRIFFNRPILVRQLKLHLLDCTLAVTWSQLTAWRGLTQTELADWQYKSESGNTNTNLKLTQTAATPYTHTTYKQYTTGRACCVYQWPTKRRQSRQLMLGRSRRRNAFSEIFKKPPDGNMMNIAKMTLRTEFAANWKSENCQWSCQS